MADRKISDLTPLTTPAPGDLLPIVDISEAAAASKNKRITIEELFRGVPLGTAAAPSIAIEGDEDTGVFSPGANQLAVATNCNERARIDSDGRLLVGTSSSFLSYAGLQIKGAIDSGAHIGLANKFSAPTDGSNIGSIRFTNDVGGIGAILGCEADGAWTAGSNYRSRLLFFTAADGASSPTERLRITSAGVLQIADAGNITVGTTTGTKIGTATTQKLGFYNATPVVQPTAVADATDAATVITQLNDLLAKLRTLGIIAT